MNPNAPIPKENKTYQSNYKHKAKNQYELQDGQVYRKAYFDSRLGEQLPSRYAICYSDAFEIMTTAYEQLLHPGKHLKSYCFIWFLLIN
jgi:hypothetical protein